MTATSTQAKRRATAMKAGDLHLISADGLGRNFHFSDPAECFIGNTPATYAAAVSAWRTRGGWLAGGLSAEAAVLFDAAPAIHSPAWPHIALFRYERPPHALREVFSDPSFSICEAAHPTRTRQAVLAAIERTRDYIASGDIFQASISQGFTGKVEGETAPLGVFAALLNANPSPMSGLLVLDEAHVVATHSPERFFSLSAEGEAESRPIKGTRPRRPEPEQDARELAALISSEKDRAENVMIVDLMRNDFSRVCVPGSVRVPELCTPHSYSNVHHLVSRVTGQLKHGCDAFDLLAASFPPGSVTGAPKLRALQIIHELEDAPRGAYCGAIGYVAPDGSADFNVMIRSVSFIRQSADDWKFVFRSGAGITIASDPGEEYAETLDKASTLLQVLG